MTKEEIIEMLNKSGLDKSKIDMMMEFSELIKDIEREACAKIAEEPWQGSPKAIAELIRARK